MITHLCSDEKFIDWVIEVFGKLNPDNNLFLVISEQKELSYIRQNNKVKVYAHYDPEILKHCNNSTAVIVHSFLDNKFYFVGGIAKQVKVLWSCWGGDFYNLKEFQQRCFSVYGQYTYKYLESQRPARSFKAKLIHHLGPLYKYYYKWKTGNYPLAYLRRKAYQRVDYLTTVIPTEYELVKNVLPVKNSITYLPFSYGSLSGVLGGFIERDFTLGTGIWVGNSAHPTNNHLEVINDLKDTKLDRDLIFPLSYGSTHYRELIIKEGQAAFGNNFIPLINFMPLEDYINLIASCSVMIMNHYRQQAVGNIIVGLYLGMKLFLNPKSSVFSFLKEKGAVIFNFDTEWEVEEEPKALDDAKKQINRAVLHEIWGDEVINNHIQFLVKKLMG